MQDKNLQRGFRRITFETLQITGDFSQENKKPCLFKYGIKKESMII